MFDDTGCLLLDKKPHLLYLSLTLRLREVLENSMFLTISTLRVNTAELTGHTRPCYLYQYFGKRLKYIYIYPGGMSFE